MICAHCGSADGKHPLDCALWEGPIRAYPEEVAVSHILEVLERTGCDDPRRCPGHLIPAQDRQTCCVCDLRYRLGQGGWLVDDREVDLSTKVKLGTVVESARNCDVIPAMLDLVRDLASPVYEQLVAGPWGVIPSWVQEEGRECYWWNGEEALCLREGLVDVLNAEAPVECYFGAHPDYPRVMAVGFYKRV